MTEAQRKALQSTADYGDPTNHLRGRSEAGGFSRTLAALIRKGWLDKNWRITPAGYAALQANDPTP